MILKDLTKYLEDNHSDNLLRGESLFIENAPADKNTALTLSLGVSREPNTYVDVHAFSVQLYARDVTAEGSYNMLIKARDAFENAKYSKLTIGGDYVYLINWERYPQYLLLDTNNRYTYTSQHVIYLRQ